ncbi:MAG TPA: phosphoenolpyruvate kinase, partial [Thermoanaerobaculia bacterium]
MPGSLTAESVRDAFERLQGANQAFMRRHPGESDRRQPVHTVYGGAHLFKADTAVRLGALALRALEEYAPTPEDLAGAVGLREDLAPVVHARVTERLRRE